MSNGGLSDTSAYRVASVRESLFVSLRRHGIRHWHELAPGPVLEWAAEPRRDRSGEVLGDRNPDDIRHRMSSARHIIKAALRLRAPVPLLDDDGELRDFLHPPQRPERASDDPAEIVDAVAAWGPQRWRHGSLRNFDMVLPGVRELVLAAGPCNVDEARLWLRVLAGFALWAVNDQHSDPVTMHTPNNVETWVLSVNADQDDDWKNKARGALRRLGPTINPAAWPRPPQPMPARGCVAPYDAKTELQFRRAALLPRRDRRARLWVDIAAPGAGLSGPEMADSEYGDLTQRRDGRWEIRVRGDKARRVPVRRDYEPLVHELVALQDQSRFIASAKYGAASQIAQRIRVGDQSLSLTASRNTFLAAHLEAGTPPAALSHIAGGVAYSTLDKLLPYVADRLDPAEAVEQALGP